MALFTVNSIDFSANVIEKSYSVQRQDLYSSWTDGNWITHREISRQQISGSFNMTFTTETEYTSFKNAIDAVKTSGGYCPVTVWVNNIKSSETINAFVEISVKNRWSTSAYGHNPEVAIVTVKIVER